MLKFEVPTLEGLPPDVAACYVAVGEGRYQLEMEETALKKALDAERQGRREAEREGRVRESAVQAKVQEAERERDAAKVMTDTLRGAVLEQAVRALAPQLRIHGPAIPDVVRAAREVYFVADDGSVTARTGGKTFADWLTGLREVSPHYFSASGAGSGSPPTHRVHAPAGMTMPRSRFDQLSPTQRAAAIADGYKIV